MKHVFRIEIGFWEDGYWYPNFVNDGFDTSAKWIIEDVFPGSKICRIGKQVFISTYASIDDIKTALGVIDISDRYGDNSLNVDDVSDLMRLLEK